MQVGQRLRTARTVEKRASSGPGTLVQAGGGSVNERSGFRAEGAAQSVVPLSPSALLAGKL